jgi:hypothetical protein
MVAVHGSSYAPTSLILISDGQISVIISLNNRELFRCLWAVKMVELGRPLVTVTKWTDADETVIRPDRHACLWCPEQWTAALVLKSREHPKFDSVRNKLLLTPCILRQWHHWNCRISLWSLPCYVERNVWKEFVIDCTCFKVTLCPINNYVHHISEDFLNLLMLYVWANAQ